MRSLRTLIPALGCILAAGGAVLAGPPDVPHRYILGGLDGRLARVESQADGVTWAVWAYRSGAEYDIALSARDGSGRWSEPVFLGARDGRSQVQPSLAADPAGNLYLAFAERESGQILLSVRRAGSDTWSPAQVIAANGQRHAMPGLRVVGGRLIVAYRAPTGIEIIDLSLLPTADPVAPSGIQDGPEPSRDSGDAEGEGPMRGR